MRTIAGTLELPDGTPIPSGVIRFTSTTSTPNTPKQVYSDINITNGSYSEDINIGTYNIILYVNGSQIGLGSNISVIAGSSIDVLSLIGASDPSTPAIQALLDLKQDLDAALTSISGLTTSADKMIYATALDTYAVTDLTAFARSILDDVDEATFKQTVNLEPGIDVQAYDVNTVSDAFYVHTDNNYTTTEKSKLAGIEAGATADQTGAEVPIIDTGLYYTSTNVEDALQEVGASLGDIGTALDIINGVVI